MSINEIKLVFKLIPSRKELFLFGFLPLLIINIGLYYFTKYDLFWEFNIFYIFFFLFIDYNLIYLFDTKLIIIFPFRPFYRKFEFDIEKIINITFADGIKFTRNSMKIVYESNNKKRRNIFYIGYITKKDLVLFCTFLEKLGVNVNCPEFET